jgi:transcriptional regulator with GAF, ATPase, and Fis domain
MALPDTGENRILTVPEFDENQFFREATLRICGSLDLPQALSRAYDYLQQHIPLRAMLMLYYDPERAAGYAMASATAESGPQSADADTPLFAVDQDTLDRLRRQGASVAADQPVRVRNRPGDDLIYRAVQRFMERQGVRHFSLLMLRLDVQVDYQGVLWMTASGHDVYTEEHARRARILAEPFAIAMSNARRHRESLRLAQQLEEDNRAMHRELGGLADTRVIGAEFGLREVMGLVRRVAPMNAPVLLQGATGTGKEVIANAIHMASPRRDCPLVRVQCGAVPDALLDSELFGHERGAFTGAFQAKRGRFERADGGTIFFDEIGELSLDAQVKLLRVLQDSTFEPLGGGKTLTVDVRVLAATNRDLEQLVSAGRFRADLWFRLNVFPIQLPPLNQRQEDIPALAQFFIDRKAREMGLATRPELDEGATEHLVAYHWPGNVRELQNVIERALILCQGDRLAFPDLHASPPAVAARVPADPPVSTLSLDEATASHIRQVMRQTNGRIQGANGAAELLGVHPSTLRARLRKLGIVFGRDTRW